MRASDAWLVVIAWRLDRLLSVPTDVLGEIVLRDGACVQAFADGDAPQLTGFDIPDRELAWRLCAGCPVKDECLELELRLAGEETTGVWGALPEDDRRALYPYWRRLGERAAHDNPIDHNPEGGQTP
jgi:WhiB family redox-sensing transcriptional regulator